MSKIDTLLWLCCGFTDEELANSKGSSTGRTLIDDLIIGTLNSYGFGRGLKYLNS